MTAEYRSPEDTKSDPVNKRKLSIPIFRYLGKELLALTTVVSSPSAILGHPRPQAHYHLY